MFAGKLGDDLRVACSLLMRRIATTFPLVYLDEEGGRDDVEKSLGILDKMLESGKEVLYIEASSTYESFSQHVLSIDAAWHACITRQILRGLTDSPVPDLQRGFALAAGVCGDSEASEEVVLTLCRAIGENQDVEVRRNAARSLSNIPLSCLHSHSTHVLQALLGGMRDYTIDDRGDIGSVVREASMKSFSEVVLRLLGGTFDSDRIWHQDLQKFLLSGIRVFLFECCGRIDRTRIVGGDVLKVICKAFSEERTGYSRTMDVCKKLSFVFHFSSDAPHETAIDSDGDIDFSRSESVFPAMQNALNIVDVREAVMRGFISTGGGTRSQFKAPCASLVDFLLGVPRDTKVDILKKEVLKPIKEFDQQLALPALFVLSSLTKHGLLKDLPADVLIYTVQSVRECWKGRTKDVKVVIAVLNTLDCLVCLSQDEKGKFIIGEDSVGKECLEAMAVILGGPIPRLRRLAAESLYTALSFCDIDGYDGGCDSSVITAMDVILQSTWEELTVGEARSWRNNVCHILRIQSPAGSSKGDVTSRKGNTNGT